MTTTIKTLAALAAITIISAGQAFAAPYPQQAQPAAALTGSQGQTVTFGGRATLGMPAGTEIAVPSSTSFSPFAGN